MAHFSWALEAYFCPGLQGIRNADNPTQPELQLFHLQQMKALFHAHSRTNMKL
jgi:hypothetical protein